MVRKARFQAQIGGISLNSTTQTRVLEEIIKQIEADKKTLIVTPNPEFIVYAQKHPWFKKILNQADFAIPDGIGLVWASRFLAFRPLGTLFKAKTPRMVARQRPRLLRGGGIQERISGTDLMEKLCQEAAKRGWSVYLLGGEPGVAAAAAAKLKKQNAKLKIWAESGPKLEIGNWKLEITEKWVEKINEKAPTFLFVAFGMGKQEKFIWDNWNRLDVRLAMGVGGAFDYLSGQVPRAPKWVRHLGFEWLYRLLHQPWRWRRQLALLQFIWLVIKEKFSS